MTMDQAAYAAGQTGMFVPTLSLDEPMNALRPWRWFCGAGWQVSATMHAMAARRPRRTPAPAPEPEATA